MTAIVRVMYIVRCWCDQRGVWEWFFSLLKTGIWSLREEKGERTRKRYRVECQQRRWICFQPFDSTFRTMTVPSFVFSLTFRREKVTPDHSNDVSKWTILACAWKNIDSMDTMPFLFWNLTNSRLSTTQREHWRKSWPTGHVFYLSGNEEKINENSSVLYQNYQGGIFHRFEVAVIRKLKIMNAWWDQRGGCEEHKASVTFLQDLHANRDSTDVCDSLLSPPAHGSLSLGICSD
jgi:hypothetical protein